MLKMLCFKPASQKLRADGTKPRTLTLRERGRKFGPIVSESHISSKKDLLIAGPQAAGKSWWIERLERRGDEVWGKRAVVRLTAVDPVSKWADFPALQAWTLKRGRAWSSLPAYARIDLLAEYIKDVRAVLLVDDCHKLTGRKLAVVVKCAECAYLVVSTTTAEQSTPITLRLLLDRRNPTRIDLASEAAYDSTSAVMWMFILVSLGAGAWQLAAVLGGLKFLAGGRGANKQS